MAKSAGTLAAIWVILAITGLVVLIGVILLMMWFGPGIQHSPSERSQLRDRAVVQAAEVSVPSVQNRVKGGV